MTRSLSERHTDPWPTEIERGQALDLTWQLLDAKAPSATAEEAWEALRTAVEVEEAWAVRYGRDIARDVVVAWYHRAEAQLGAGVRCQQRWCFEVDLRRRQRAAELR
jgi:hypothetical protein